MWLRRVRDRIDREYSQPLDVEALARGVHMSAGHLSRQFRLAYGESPYSYLMTRRIERAMALLRRGDLSVTEVCFAVGCSETPDERVRESNYWTTCLIRSPDVTLVDSLESASESLRSRSFFLKELVTTGGRCELFSRRVSGRRPAMPRCG